MDKNKKITPLSRKPRCRLATRLTLVKCLSTEIGAYCDQGLCSLQKDYLSYYLHILPSVANTLPSGRWENSRYRLLCGFKDTKDQSHPCISQGKSYVISKFSVERCVSCVPAVA